MDKDLVLMRLKEVESVLKSEFRVVFLALFGSTARGTAAEGSDVDLVVSFKGKADFDTYMDLKFFLEDLFGRKVDLVTQNAIRPEMRNDILEEMIRVA